MSGIKFPGGSRAAKPLEQSTHKLKLNLALSLSLSLTLHTRSGLSYGVQSWPTQYCDHFHLGHQQHTKILVAGNDDDKPIWASTYDHHRCSEYQLQLVEGDQMLLYE